ncbi:hypothetical protein L596_001803 [Steinernema carpocapsae]|uniref:Uncharacterized protein n=1 Tax=Steinernema carpocapsae TaxID=34508 RepID=A0A4V6I7H9_STECR|nr:hypothetical protein L596_001803 [Steinernema carpocapsae]
MHIVKYQKRRERPVQIHSVVDQLSAIDLRDVSNSNELIVLSTIPAKRKRAKSKLFMSKYVAYTKNLEKCSLAKNMID